MRKLLNIVVFLFTIPFSVASFAADWYGMSVDIECEGGPSSAPTDNDVYLKFYDQNGNAVSGHHTINPDACLQGLWPFRYPLIHGSTQHRASTTPITEVEITNSGSDAFWIDYVKLTGYKYASNAHASPITGTTFRHQAGSDNSYGWALSTDSKDWKGWERYLPSHSSPSCRRFKKGSNKAHRCR